jgi:hypothetical protein
MWGNFLMLSHKQFEIFLTVTLSIISVAFNVRVRPMSLTCLKGMSKTMESCMSLSYINKLAESDAEKVE